MKTKEEKLKHILFTIYQKGIMHGSNCKIPLFEVKNHVYSKNETFSQLERKILYEYKKTQT